MVHLHEGHLGEVTKGWGSDLAKPPHLPNTSTTTSPKKQEPVPEITNKLWQDWRSKELNQELTTNNKKTGTEQETEITLNQKITIKLKQPKLEDIIRNPNNKVQSKTKTSGNNITNIRSSKQDTNNMKKEKTQTTSTNENKKSCPEDKKITRSIEKIMRKPTLEITPEVKITPKQQEKKQEISKISNKQQEISVFFTVEEKHPNNKQISPSKKRVQENPKPKQNSPKISNYAKKKRRKENFEKTEKQLQGYWLKFAEKRKQEKLAPVYAARELPYCKVKNNSPSTAVNTGEIKLLEHSTSNLLIKSNNESEMQGNREITPGFQIGLEKSI